MPEFSPFSKRAEKETRTDLDWIESNIQVLWRTAEIAYLAHGPGALVVDTDKQVKFKRQRGNPVVYFRACDIEAKLWKEATMMVRVYTPSDEFVIVLRREDICSYRVNRPSEQR